MHQAMIGIGSNVGDKQANLHAARDAMAVLPGTRLVAFSSLFRTDPVGPIEQDDFLNAAAWLETGLAPLALLGELNKIEQHAGRETLDERVKWGPRVLDLDILLYDDLVLEEDDLSVPHPHMHVRRFVLDPLAEIAPDAVHPKLGKTVKTLLAELPADSD